MSTSSKSDCDDSIFEIEELLLIEARCRELRREKDLLKETQSQSFDLIKKLEVHARRLNEAHSGDKRRIQQLEKELCNCHQEIDYLQDQLNTRNSEMESMEEEILSLREEVKKSNSQCDFLMQELETREAELQKSNLHIANLEESISSASLEYQCEIESMRLEMMSLEPTKFEEGSTELLHELQLQIKLMEDENKQMKDTLNASQKEVELFCQKVQDHFKISIEDHPSYEILGSLLSKLLTIRSPNLELVKQLKDELKDEKLRAKEEAEDLAQEMAELRYQLTEMLEEEQRRRAYIEQVSLQRISELEAQLRIEQRKSAAQPVQYICEI